MALWDECECGKMKQATEKKCSRCKARKDTIIPPFPEVPGTLCGVYKKWRRDAIKKLRQLLRVKQHQDHKYVEVVSYGKGDERHFVLIKKILEALGDEKLR